MDLLVNTKSRSSKIANKQMHFIYENTCSFIIIITISFPVIEVTRNYEMF